MDSIDIWFPMLWKDMEMPLEVKLERKPCGKENFDRRWRMTVRNWLKLAPLFACVGAGMVMSGFYLLRLATKGPEVTWSRVKNPEPWQVIGPNHRVKFWSPTDYSKFSRPAPQESYDAIKGV